MPALTSLAIWFPPFDELVVESARTARPGSIAVMDLTPGPLLALFVGAVPLFGSWFGVAGLTPSGIDVTPFLFAITIPIIAWAVSHYRLLDIVPNARAQVIADLEDGIIVVDHAGRIVDVNETGRRFLDAPTSELEGARASDVLERFPEIAPELDEHGGQPVEVDVTRDGEHHVCDVTVTEFAVESSNPGFVIVLRDITERRHAPRRFRTLIEQTADIVTIHSSGLPSIKSWTTQSDTTIAPRRPSRSRSFSNKPVPPASWTSASRTMARDYRRGSVESSKRKSRRPSST